VGRLLIVSNRLPITVSHGPAGLSIDMSSGGLATGLGAFHERSQGLWFGWPGETSGLDASEQDKLDAELASRRLVGIPLTESELESYYERMSNGIFWPVFHHQPYPLEMDGRDWDVYTEVNERFAETVAREYREGDRIWVQDYQLMLVPEMLRRRLPRARIGFFLHIPFPSSEIFRTLPQRERVLTGMLGADVIGFHTATYVRAFASSVARVLGLLNDVDRIRIGSRQVQLGVFPMGIDAQGFAAIAAEHSVEEEVRAIRGSEDTKLLVGIDRLDYTKGIPRRLLGFERLLEERPELHGRVRFVQVAVPSREDVGAYQEFRNRAYELVGRIHGRFATPYWVPVYWIYRYMRREAVVALYRSADVMVVTPVRDGMNLVAKEFVASRTDGDGVLLLSEFAGAASELAEAVLVNPYDMDGLSRAYHEALTMPEEERRWRMQALRRRVFAFDVERWGRTFLEALERAEPTPEEGPTAPSPPEVMEGVRQRIRQAEHLVLLLDFDGTLVPFAESPELARPDPPLLDLLGELAARPRTDVHVVSGRARDTLERWLGWLPIGLHLEHGMWSRAPGGGDWQSAVSAAPDWRPTVRPILEDWSARTPGSFIEEKTSCIAWHYRAADPEYGPHQAKELQVHLRELLTNVPVEILPGDKVIEIRPHGANKGSIVAPLVAAAPAGALVVAIGDDRTDEDLFAAVPEDGIAIHVGPKQSRAPFRLAEVSDVRELLRSLLAAA